MGQRPSSLETARAAKAKVARLLSGRVGVQGIGITQRDHGFVIKVNLATQLKSDVDLPHEVGGVPVIFEVVGRVTKR